MMILSTLLFLALIGAALLASRWKARREIPWMFALGLFGMLTLRFLQIWIFPVPNVSSDSSSYWNVAQQLLGGEWPQLAKRPIAFPALMAIGLSTSWGLWLTLLFQHFFAWASWGVLAWGLCCRFPATLGIAAVVLALGWLNAESYFYDHAILSESLYASGIRFCMGFLLWGWATQKSGFFLAASLAAGLSYHSRPSGIGLLVPLALTPLFIPARLRARLAAASLAPFLVLVLALAVYNQVRIGGFPTTIGSQESLVQTTGLFWPKVAPAHPVFAPILEKGRLKDQAQDLEKARSSWNPSELWDLQLKHFAGAWLGRAFFETVTEMEKDPSFGPYPYGHLVRYYAQVGKAAIVENPDIFAKVFVVNLGRSLFLNPGLKNGAYALADLNARNLDPYLNRPESPESDAQVAYAAASPSPARKGYEEWAARQPVEGLRKHARRIFERFAQAAKLGLTSPLWGILLVLGTLVSGIGLLFSRKVRWNEESRMWGVAVFWAGTSWLALTAPTSAVQLADSRYTLPQEFLIVLGALMTAGWLESTLRGRYGKR